MSRRTSRSHSFLRNVLTLSGATAIVKLISALFKIPLANILGGLGMSYFVSAYDIFTPVYAFTVTGLGVAISRCTAEYAATGPCNDVIQVLYVGEEFVR